MSEFRTVGIVLKRTNYAEADQIFKIFTREEGMIGVIAKGVRKIKSKKAASLESFQIVELTLLRKTGELFLVTGTRSVDHGSRRFDLPELAVLYAVAEWLLALLPAEKAVPELFDLVVALRALLPTTKKYALITLAMKTKMLGVLGFLSEDFADARTQKLLRFLVASDLPTALRLADDPAAFAKAGEELETIFSQITDRASRVPSGTASWYDARS